ncbi:MULTISPECIES: tetratricopeptide repeat protein [Streptomyces violaceusniger group]|uniref:tetratricopeptide repeat protein n=1 Tax=Streptomyces violaceusniger group TaxID=2839105 RepID=UPI001BAA431F|nr:tetratricopeptide repeat protein [Streptomyces asiaticus]
MFPHDRGQQQADDDARQASVLAATAEDSLATCRASNISNIIASFEKRHEDAEAHFREALKGFRADNNLSGAASALSNLSRVHAATGRVDSAIELGPRMLAQGTNGGTPR